MSYGECWIPVIGAMSEHETDHRWKRITSWNGSHAGRHSFVGQQDVICRKSTFLLSQHEQTGWVLIWIISWCLFWKGFDSNQIPAWCYYRAGWQDQCPINSSSLGQNGCHFADNIFKCIFKNDNFSISIKISLKFVLKDQIDNNTALV